jgi:hypothetical protein
MRRQLGFDSVSMPPDTPLDGPMRALPVRPTFEQRLFSFEPLFRVAISSQSKIRFQLLGNSDLEHLTKLSVSPAQRSWLYNTFDSTSWATQYS